MTDNALNSLFRHQSYYLTLPSGGKYYKTAPKLSADGELGLMPMTATDEIKLKSPDALFNGDGLYQLFKSCAPNIPEPSEIPAIDIDAILIGIRLAAGEETLTMNSKCPSCGHMAPYEIDLNQVLRSIKPKSFDNIVDLHKDVSVTLRPITIETQIKTQIETFYQLQMQQALNNADADVDASRVLFGKALSSAIELQLGQVADCIQSVKLKKDDNDIVVDNPDHIMEWVRNMTKADHKAISDRIELISSTHKIEDMDLKCPECGHEYKIKVELNPANFF